MKVLDSKSEPRCSTKFVICAALLVALLFVALGLYLHRVNTAISAALGKVVLPSVAQAISDQLLARHEYKQLVGEVVGEFDCTAVADRDPPVVLLLQSDRREDRIAAAFALGECRQLALAALDDLTMALDDSDPTVQAYAAYALGELGDQAQTALPRLKQAERSRLDSVRRAAAEAITKIEGRDEPR